MPGFVKTPKDEKRWEKAKVAARKTLSEADGDRFWALTNSIYQKMSKSDDVESLIETLLKARRLLSDEPSDPYEEEDPYSEEAGFRTFDPESEDDDASKWLYENDPERREKDVDEDERPSEEDIDYDEYKPDEDDESHQREIESAEAPSVEAESREKRPEEVSESDKPTQEVSQEEVKREGRFPQPSKEDIAEMRQYTRPWEQRARETARLGAEAHKNPVLHGEGRLIEARNEAHKSHKEAFQQMLASTEYQNADPITQMEMETNFEKEFHANNPEYLKNAAKLHQEAHQKGAAAKDVHAAAKHEQIQHILRGGAQADMPMSTEEALQHAGGMKGEEGTEGAMTQDPASTFARGNQDFLRQYARDYERKAKKPKDVNEMMQLDEESKADLHRVLGEHPALKDPSKKAKVDEFFKKYHALIGMSASRVLDKMGIDRSKGTVDLGMLHEAGMHGLFQAINDYDHDHPSKASFATHAGNKIRGLMQTAMRAQDQIPAELRVGAKKFKQAESPKETEQKVPAPASIPSTSTAPQEAPSRKDVKTILKKPLRADHEDRLKRILTAAGAQIPKTPKSEGEE